MLKSDHACMFCRVFLQHPEPRGISPLWFALSVKNSCLAATASRNSSTTWWRIRASARTTVPTVPTAPPSSSTSTRTSGMFTSWPLRRTLSRRRRLLRLILRLLSRRVLEIGHWWSSIMVFRRLRLVFWKAVPITLYSSSNPNRNECEVVYSTSYFRYKKTLWMSFQIKKITDDVNWIFREKKILKLMYSLCIYDTQNEKCILPSSMNIPYRPRFNI